MDDVKDTQCVGLMKERTEKYVEKVIHLLEIHVFK